jgi:hypothetical protein
MKQTEIETHLGVAKTVTVFLGNGEYVNSATTLVYFKKSRSREEKK